jgi:hypothetical protein
MTGVTGSGIDRQDGVGHGPQGYLAPVRLRRFPFPRW